MSFYGVLPPAKLSCSSSMFRAFASKSVYAHTAKIMDRCRWVVGRLRFNEKRSSALTNGLHGSPCWTRITDGFLGWPQSVSSDLVFLVSFSEG